MYSTSNSNVQINVRGWRLYYHNEASNGWRFDIYYNTTTARAIIADPACWLPSNPKVYSNDLKDTWIRPLRPVMKMYQGVQIRVSDDGNIYVNSTDNDKTWGVYIQIDWTHRRNMN